ncbi:hypothetical protein SNOG_15687 [Parastagonospora nodorum SN15]|uniref:Uncharacterized protein n=1 Tax=Phaeosphaeria nodorum (strain SN15 / ATCC MYA-4574 / FGSC 10173) TaxID=321614 RepID=Q0TY63_PHANO|nr:hypothetical protein SNOG_15687 [Parastagonospora nodorum SN15]EAT77062.1 hypothetical protein SNOG_15687 [Parastagonospora nodorum SN15]
MARKPDLCRTAGEELLHCFKYAKACFSGTKDMELTFFDGESLL